MNTLELLNEFKKGKLKYIALDKGNNWNNPDNEDKIIMSSYYAAETPGFDKQGPLSFEEAMVYREFPIEENSKKTIKMPTFIPDEAYNKSFFIEDFEITVLNKKYEHSYDNGSEYFGCKDICYYLCNDLFIYITYHGVLHKVAEYEQNFLILAADCKPNQTNWREIKPTKEKPYMLKEIKVTLNGGYYNKIEEIFKSINFSKIVFHKPKIEFNSTGYNIYILKKQNWFDSNKSKYTQSNKDIEFFVKSETKDGVYKPEKATIANFLFKDIEYKYETKFQTLGDKHDHKLLKKLGIHTVQFRNDAHFNILNYFDMNGVLVKAPQKVIEKYNLIKYCSNDGVVEKIKKETKEKEDEEKRIRLNNTFSLYKNGKVFMKDVQSEDIVSYLESFDPNGSIEEQIIQNVKPIFDNYNIKKLYIAYWGRFFKYECAGEICDINYEVFNVNKNNIKPDILEEIQELYEDAITPKLNKKNVGHTFGWPDRGGLIMGVKKTRGKLEVFTEDYDLE